MLRVRAPAERWRCRLTNGGLQGHGVPLQLAGGRDAGRHGPILPSRNRGRGALHFCGSGRRRGAHARFVARPRGPQHRGCAACTKESAHRLCAELGPTRGEHSSPCTSEHKMHPIGWSIVAHKPITGYRDSMFAPTVQSVACHKAATLSAMGARFPCTSRHAHHSIQQLVDLLCATSAALNQTPQDACRAMHAERPHSVACPTTNAATR